MSVRSGVGGVDQVGHRRVRVDGTRRDPGDDRVEAGPVAHRGGAWAEPLADERPQLGARPLRTPCRAAAVRLEMAAVREDRRPEVVDAAPFGRDGLAAKRAARSRDELRSLVREQVGSRAAVVCEGPSFDELVTRVAERALDPYAAVASLLDDPES